MATEAEIQQIYQNVLGRKADDAGLQHWTNNAANMSVDDLTNQFKQGDEYKINEVNNAYSNLLGRDGSAEGVANWVGSGLTGEALTNSMTGTVYNQGAGRDYEHLFGEKEKTDKALTANTYTPNANTIYTPTTYDVEQNEVDSQALVSEQLNTMLNSNSPLMKSAETKARQQMNSRGLLNSSMAIEAGQKAMVDAALPVAQQDAKTYETQNLTNQEYVNVANRDNNALINDAGKFNAGFNQNLHEIAVNFANSLSLQEDKQAFELQLNDIKLKFEQMMDDERFDKGLISDEYANTQNAIANILIQDGLDEASKINMINTYMSATEQDIVLKQQLSEVDLTMDDTSNTTLNYNEGE